MINPNRFYPLFFFLVIFTPLQAVEKKKIKKIELLRSSETEYLTFEEGKEKIIIFRGGVLLKFQENILRAETVKFNPNTGEIFGEGNIKWLNGNKKIEGDSFFFDNNKQTGIVFEGKTKIKPVYYYGDSFKQLKKDHYLVSLASFTTCDLENPHYSFKAKKLWIYPNNKLVALHILYQISDIPVFYWPLIFQTELGTGIRTLYGYNQTKGHYLQNTYYFSLPFLDEYDIFPEVGKVFFDYYQYTGELYGFFFKNKSKNFHYNLDLELANFRRKNTICDTIFEGSSTNCRENTTNFFPDVSRGASIQSSLWWKINTQMNVNWVSQGGLHSQIVFELTELRHRNFEPEFGRRFEPQTTLESIYLGPVFRNVGPETLYWRAEYHLSTESTHFNIQFIRAFRWYQTINELDSKYLPIYETLPQINFSTSHQIIPAAKKFFSGSWLIFDGTGSIQRLSTQGIYSQSNFKGNGEVKNVYQFYFLSWFRVEPYFSYGLRYATTIPQNPDLIRESRRQSYHFLTTKAPLRIGNYSTYLKVEHEYQYFFLRETLDPTFGQQGLHFMNFLLKGDFHPLFFFSINTSRDLRHYPYVLDERFLWKPLKVSTNVGYELFMNHGEKQISGKKFSFYVSFDNTYRYLIRFNRHGTNNAYLNFGLSGIKTNWIKKINQISFSIGWHHNFIDLRQDDLTFKFKLDTQILSDLRVVFETSSRADQFERYREGVNFFDDLLTGFNLFSSERNNTVLNLDFLRLTLERQLHRWTLKIYYERSRKTIFLGGNLKNRTSFYEEGVYLGLSLTDFDFFQGQQVQISRNNPGDSLRQ